MPIPQPDLLTSSGTAFQISTLQKGSSIPTVVTITVTAAATIGAESLAVTINPTTALLKNGLYILGGVSPNEQWIVVAADTLGTATTLPVEPLKFAIAANSTLRTSQALPLIGLEGANLQLQTEMNSAVLMSNQGWQINDYSTGSWQFSGNLYLPRNTGLAAPAESVLTALLNKDNIYTERILSNGTLFAGMAMVSNASDTTSGAQYVTIAVTFQGSGRPTYRRLNG